MSMFDRVHQAEIWEYEHDILCAHHIDYLDCGDCRMPDAIMEAIK